MKKLKFILLVIIPVLFGEINNVNGQCALTNSYAAYESCDASSSVCQDTFSISVQTSGSLLVQYTASNSHCADVIMHFLLDGIQLAVSGILSPGNASGYFDFGPVTSGTHMLQFQMETWVNGCYVAGQHWDWGGIIDVTTSAAFPSKPGPIAVLGGIANVCPGETRTYTTSNATGIIWYWTVPPGAYINSGQGTNTINVTYDENFISSGTISVIKINACNDSSTVRNLKINRNNPVATISTIGPTVFCAGTNPLTLLANTGTGYTYQWKKGSVDIAGATNQSYTPTSTSSGYRVVVTNGAGCSQTSAKVAVTVNPLPVSTITPLGSTTFCAGDSVILQANTGAGLTYQWKKGANLISGATQQLFTSKIAGSYKVIVTNSNSCSRTSAATVVTVNCRLSNETTETTGYKIYPNPSQGFTTLNIYSATNQQTDLIVTDVTGRRIIQNQITLAEGENEISFDLTDFANGIYFVNLKLNETNYFERVVKD